jgi:putative DNA-invertase from lambdoid prophage Rac
MISSTRPPHAWLYCRASTDSQKITVEAQEEGNRRYFDYHLKPKEVAFGCCFKDSAQSGGMAWNERTQGKLLWEVVQPGDHIIVAKLDRAFRSVVDANQTIEKLLNSQITLHIVNLAIDLSTSHGRFFFRILVDVAQLEREMISERTSEALQWKRKRGLPTGGPRPIGWIKQGKGKDSRWLPDKEARKAAYLVLEMRAKGLEWWEIPNQLRKLGVVSTVKNKMAGLKQVSQATAFKWMDSAKDGFPLPNGHRQHCFPWEPQLWRSWGIDYRGDSEENV